MGQAGMGQAGTHDFLWPIRVYWEDTDAGGIVFYANYLKYFERARTEWLRSLGIQQRVLQEQSGGMFVVSETQVRYQRPARLDDPLIIRTQVLELGRASMVLEQQALLFSELPTHSQSALQAEIPRKTAAESLAQNLQFNLLLNLQANLQSTDLAQLPLLCQGSIRIGWVNALTLQPARIPHPIREAFL